MEHCCSQFAQAVQAGEVARSEADVVGSWNIPRLWPLHYCPFCGEDLTCVPETHEELPDRSTLEGLLLRIGEAAYFRGFEVTGPNSLGLFGTTPLHIAATWGDCEAIRMLVEAGADLDACGEHDFTPLMEAVSQGHVEAVTLLVKLGAKPLANEDGHSPSEFAAILKNSALEQFLVSKGF